MPSVVNTLMKVTLTGSYFSQIWKNVFWYYNVGGSGTDSLINVADEFNDNVIPSFALAVNTDTLINEIRVDHVNGTLADYVRGPSITVGAVVGTAMPPFLAASIRLNRTTKETRNGWKRVIGLIEENVGALSFGGGYVTLLGALGTAIEDKLDMGGGLNNMEPSIIREVTPGVFLYNLINGHLVINEPTTQNTRKVGRGI